VIPDRVHRWVESVRVELRKSFVERHTPEEIAGSFAVGTFVTALPTLGTGLAVLAAIAYVSEKVNRIALFAAVLVFNPAVKSGVYAASFTVGVSILGPVEGVSLEGISPATAGPSALARLLLGNLLLAVALTVPSYFAVRRFAVAYRTDRTGSIPGDSGTDAPEAPGAEAPEGIED